MATLPTLYCINASDAPQHLGKIQRLSQKFKQEQRITDFIPLFRSDVPGSLHERFKENDLIIVLLTYEVEGTRKHTATMLKNVQGKFSESNTEEIIQFVNENNTALNVDAAWSEIEDNLKQALPTTDVDWKKYLKYAVPAIVVLAAFGAPYEVNFKNKSNIAGTINPSTTLHNNDAFAVKLTASRDDKVDATTRRIVVSNVTVPVPEDTQATIARFTPDKTDCMIPCTIRFTNQSQNATTFSWDFGDGSSSTDKDPVHKYTAGGNYQVRLVARNGDQQIEASAGIRVEATVKVAPRNVGTDGGQARLVAGDREIDSDDYTSVELSYSLNIVNSGRELQLSIKWYSQELNRDLTKGDTRFMSTSNNYTLLNTEVCCPGTVIDKVVDIATTAKHVHTYQGEVHEWKEFSNTGALRNIRVIFDGPGGNDQNYQGMQATFQGFTVKLRSSN